MISLEGVTQVCYVHGKKQEWGEYVRSAGVSADAYPYSDYHYIDPINAHLATLGIAAVNTFYPVLSNPANPGVYEMNEDFGGFARNHKLNPAETLFISYSLGASYLIAKCIEIIRREHNSGHKRAYGMHPRHIAINPMVSRAERHASLMQGSLIMDPGLMSGEGETLQARFKELRRNTAVLCEETKPPGQGPDYVSQLDYFGEGGLGLTTATIPEGMDPKSAAMGEHIVCLLTA